MPYKFLEDVSIADVAFEAAGETLEELFEAAALAVTNTMVERLETVEQKAVREIELESDSAEILLFEFLQELVYYKDVGLLLFSKFKIKIEENGKLRLKALAQGEELDMNKHELLADVKAVTMHLFEVKKEARGWMARVVLDV